MSDFRRLASACVFALAAVSTAAHGQQAAPCPSLPADAELAWQRLDGAGFTFCKAVPVAGGEPVFSVTLSRESTFKPRRGDRLQQAVVDGHPVHWYRGEVSGAQAVEVRETLVELSPQQQAHISLRASSDESLATALRLAESLRFDDPRFSSN